MTKKEEEERKKKNLEPMKLSHLFISSHLLISSIYLKKNFQVSDMDEWTDGDAMCSDTGEKK